MRRKTTLLLALWSFLFTATTTAQKTIVNGVVKSQIFFNESAFSYGTSLDGLVGNTEILSRTGDVYLSTDSFRTNSLIVKNITGNVGIGTITPKARLDVNGNIFTSGKLAIGTTDTSKIGAYSLAVNGDAIFNKVKVRFYTGWPDYVFKKEYALPTLKDIETFIVLNGHLPEVLSAKEVEDKGIDVAENQSVLLKKIEELTLYLIEQDKKERQHQDEIEKMQTQINDLKALLLKKQ
ncbi:MAG: hypothetical protein ABI416_02125 [Ginsengibacter sp.]